MQREIPVYNVVFDPTKASLGLEFVSLVEDPAILEKGLAFNKQIKFAIDRDRQVIIGPAMIPDLPLYRKDDDGTEYYVVFSAQVIEEYFEKFMREPKDFKINVDHDRVVEAAFIKSAWIIEDATYDKSAKYGFSFPIGTLMLEVKVEDSDFWLSEVKESGKYGFSVEGRFDLELTEKAIAANNNTNPKTKTKMKNKFDAKVLLSELSPEEVEILKDAITEAAPEVAAEIVEEVLGAVEETINELMPEEAEEVVEAAKDGKEEDEEVKAEAVTEEAIMAIVAPMMEAMQAQMDELIMQVAELKSGAEGVEAPADDVVVEASAHTKIDFIRSYNDKFNA